MTPVPVRTEVEVVEPVSVEVTSLQGQSEPHQVRPEGRLPNHQLALSPELTGGVPQLFEEARAMHPPRLVAVEFRRRDRAKIDPESNEENQSGEQGVPAREHRLLLRGGGVERVEESGERLGHASRITQA